MKKLILILCFFTSFSAISQYRFPQNNDVDYDDPAFETVKEIIDEARNNSQLEVLAHELLDVIGPRLTGTPQMKQAADWAVNKYTGWGINAELHEFGEWMGWERGITHIDMTSPRMRTLSGRQLAYSPSTSEDGITGEIVFIPEVENKQEFTDWLETIKGKFVLSSMNQPSGRPDYNWEAFATEESLKKIRNERKEAARKWSANFRKMGVNRRKINSTLEEAGAIGLLSNNWAGGFGANRVFSAGTKNIPNIDLDLEDYT
ncbi:MAG: peptidase M28, partial [Flavobacteriaceae bacterium]